jgi:DNA polymerase I
LRLYNGVRLVNRPSPQNVMRLDIGCMPMIADMHRNGIWLNQSVLQDLSKDLAERAAEEMEGIRECVGREVNPNSSKAVGELLFQELELIPQGRARRTKLGAVSVDDDMLSGLIDKYPDQKVIRHIQSLRGIRKLKSTYVDPLPLLCGPDGRLRTTFRTTKARTGRLTSEEPNLQNIPVRSKEGARIREAFQAYTPNRSTVLGSIDLSQIEMVTTAHQSQDQNMMEVFHKKQDIHLKTVCGIQSKRDGNRPGEIGYDYDATEAGWKKYKKKELGEKEMEVMRKLEMGPRLCFKSVGFGVLFGQTPPGLQNSILSNGGGLVTLPDCESYIAEWFGLYPGVRDFMDKLYSWARRYGCVWDIFGRTRLIPGAKSSLTGISSAALREAGNQPIQASAQGIIKLAMAAIMPVVREFRECGEVCLPLLQIHDELIFELGDGIAEMFLEMARGIMTSVVPLSVPVRASMSVGQSWKELK